MNYKLISIFLVSLFIATSCVSPRLFKDEKNRRVESEQKVDELKASNKDLTEKYNEAKAGFDKMKADYDKVMASSSVSDKKYNDLQERFDKLNSQYKSLVKDVENRIKKGDSETEALLKNVQQMQNDLQQREDKLKELEASLNETKKSLDLQKLELEQKNSTLQAKQAKIDELERMLAAKDSASMALRKKISDALTGFEGNGLTVERRNGKVYVSMDETLLFKTGSDKVNPRGINALNKLSEALATTEDVNILVEGHTDDVGDANYNWDLSVKRATSVVKIMLTNKKLLPTRVTAAGHGEYMPLVKGTTDEARAKNRRTEIVLEPNFDKLLNLLNN